MKALKGRTNVKFKMYPTLNHLFAAGTGPATPKEYSQHTHVDPEVIRDITNWINARM